MKRHCSQGALSARRRLVVETGAAELDPSSDGYKKPELVAFAHDVAEPLLARGGLPVSKPHIKLLFSSLADATLAGASIFTTSLPVSVLGHPSAVGPRDGAFVVVAPAPSKDYDVERALADLLEEAGSRLVILINPRLGNAPLLTTFEPAYLMRPLSVGYMRDQLAQQVERVPACLLRCCARHEAIEPSRRWHRASLSRSRTRSPSRWCAVPCRPARVVAHGGRSGR